jgi:hypothetical protein
LKLAQHHLVGMRPGSQMQISYLYNTVARLKNVHQIDSICYLAALILS